MCVCVCVVTTCFQNTRGQLIYGLAQRRSVLKHMFFVSDFGVHHALRILIGTHILTLRPRYWPTIRRHIAPLKSPIWDRPWSSHRCICKGNQLFMSGINQPIEASLSIQVCPKKFWGWDWDHQSYSGEGSGFLGHGFWEEPTRRQVTVTVTVILPY